MIGLRVIYIRRHYKPSAIDFLQYYPKKLLRKTQLCHISYKLSNDKNDKAVMNKIIQEYPTVYNSTEVEKYWYEWWQNAGYFQPLGSKNQKVFSMILPPPNITGTLHLGHALTVTVQDVLVRWYRMRGKSIATNYL